MKMIVSGKVITYAVVEMADLLLPEKHGKLEEQKVSPVRGNFLVLERLSNFFFKILPGEAYYSP